MQVRDLYVYIGLRINGTTYLSTLDVPGILHFGATRRSLPVIFPSGLIGPFIMLFQTSILFLLSLLPSIVVVQAQSCSASNPCKTGCCSKFGFCGLGPDCKTYHSHSTGAESSGELN